MSIADRNEEKDIRKLKQKIMTDLSPDLRELTTYCRYLQLTKHAIFQSTEETENRSAESDAAAMASYTDRTLVHAIAQISDFKEIEAPLAGQKDSSLRSMSRILTSLASKALDRSRSTGNYVHLTHVFFEDFAPTSVVSKNTFYGYKAAVTRYALKRVAGLLPYLPTNVDKEEVAKGFQSLMSADRYLTASYPSNVDTAVDTQTANVDNPLPHRLTGILMNLGRHVVVEDDPKLAVYPWFANRRHRTKTGISPMLTKAEVADLAECVRFICHYPPDLEFERRGIAGKKKSREFVFEEVFMDGLLLDAAKPQFLSPRSSKRAFDRANTETKKDIGKRDKRLASTVFQPSHFWLDVEARISDQATKEVIAAQLITGCRPAELVDGVIVATAPSNDPEGLGKLHFTIFGAKMKTPSGDANTGNGKQIDGYLRFLNTSSLAKNSKIRGQFFHTESHEVFPQFPERVWLYTLLSDRFAEQVDRDSSDALSFLLEKAAHFRKLPQTEALQPEIIELSSTDQRLIVQQLRQRTGKTEVSPEEIQEEVDRRNELSEADHGLTEANAASLSEDFQAYVSSEIRKVDEARQSGDLRLVSPYQTAKPVRFRFLPHQASFPLMSEIDGIAFMPSNVDNLALPTALPRFYLRNEFSETDLDLIGIPEDERLLLHPSEFAQLQKERADYLASAVVQLGKRYKTAASGGTIEPTPYTARHRLLSDLKGLKDEAGLRLLSREEIARKAGHASTASQTGYGKVAFAEKGSRNRGQSLNDIKSAQNVRNPKSTAGQRLFVGKAPGFRPPEPRYEPKD